MKSSLSIRVLSRAFVWGFANIFDIYKTTKQRSQELQDILGHVPHKNDYWVTVGGYLKDVERKHGKEISNECWVKN